jgi:hypothetical protein
MKIGRACQPFPLLPPQLMRYCGSKDADLIEASSAKTVINIGLHAAATYHEHMVKIRYNFEAVWLGPVSPEPELASAYVEYAPSTNPVASREKIRRISINVRHQESFHRVRGRFELLLQQYAATHERLLDLAMAWIFEDLDEKVKLYCCCSSYEGRST